MFKTPLLWLIALLLFASCGDNIEFEYSDHHCYLTIDNSTHLDATLASSMNQMSPGVFTIIRPVYRNGANFFSFTNNQGCRRRNASRPSTCGWRAIDVWACNRGLLWAMAISISPQDSMPSTYNVPTVSISMLCL